MAGAISTYSLLWISKCPSQGPRSDILKPSPVAIFQFPCCACPSDGISLFRVRVLDTRNGLVVGFKMSSSHGRHCWPWPAMANFRKQA